MKGRWIGLFAVLAACSSRGGGLDSFIDGGANPDGTAVDDTRTSPGDTGPNPNDAGAPGNDVGTPPTDAGTPPADTGPVTGCTIDSECRALGRVCDRVMNRCVECIVDADCARGRFCLPSHVCTVQVCTPGESSCLGTSRQSACNSRGSAQVESDCASGEPCRAGRCQPAACTPDSRMCVDTTSLRTCNSSGTEATTMVCPPMPNATGACGAGACGFACLTGYGDCNRTASDGCEATFASSNAHCGACGRACATGQTCQSGTCGAPNFRVTSLGTTGCRVVGHAAVTGGDRGGIAVTSDAVYYTGDVATARATTELAGLASVGARHDGIFSDLATGEGYVLLTGTGAQPVRENPLTTITYLGRVTSTGALSTERIVLSEPMTLVTHTASAAVFAGYGQVVIFSGHASTSTTLLGNWYVVSLPGGRVRHLGAFAMGSPRSFCESWATWGIAESIGGDLSVLYVESSTSIARMRLADRSITRTTFTNLSDMCSISFSPTRNRWYFHAENETQFSTTVRDQQVGYCDGSWTAVP